MITFIAYLIVALMMLCVLIWAIRGLLWVIGWAAALGLVAYSILRTHFKHLDN